MKDLPTSAIAVRAETAVKWNTLAIKMSKEVLSLAVLTAEAECFHPTGGSLHRKAGQVLNTNK